MLATLKRLRNQFGTLFECNSTSNKKSLCKKNIKESYQTPSISLNDMQKTGFAPTRLPGVPRHATEVAWRQFFARVANGNGGLSKEIDSIHNLMENRLIRKKLDMNGSRGGKNVKSRSTAKKSKVWRSSWISH